MVLATNLLPFVGLVGGLFGLAAVAGAVYAVLRSNTATTTIELYKGEATAALMKAERLEKAHEACEVRLGALETQYADLRTMVDNALQGKPRPRQRKV